MENLIFLSYSRMDIETARNLYKKLKTAGHSVWFDKESLLPGQDWEIEIRRAIVEAKAILICLSSSWVERRGYIQKELKLAIEVMKEIPEGEIHTIPVRLDDCQVPSALAKLQWVDIFEPDGIERLQQALERFRSVQTSQNSTVKALDIDAYSEFMEDVISKGGLIHSDPWREAQTQEEFEFKRLLKDRWNESMNLQKAERYQEIIDLWYPLENDVYFRVDHKEWSDKPYFRCQIHTAKSHLFIAHVQLGTQGNSETHIPCAFRLLEEVLAANPYSMKGGAPDRLPANHAEIQNLNYKDTLKFAIEWFGGWGGGVLEIFGISRSECERLEKRVYERLHEIDLLFKIRSNSA
ncbi:MAG: toll/interleukin-1 receptor domain-containing protein [Candidatus Scalindua sp.]|jgi:hypothetical protein|nr:toll/interleukin-1 receptor domain-containing protein [Candidatus Scalindua sp.]MBT6045407.1 toll/interleukin-1 receptor domain-containing protein [Candidatus Scalindua sp.]MBT6227145.1 toll/interleukin-1 receptor domain-containing protein [Candidatus Scalindua sp.]